MDSLIMEECMLSVVVVFFFFFLAIPDWIIES